MKKKSIVGRRVQVLGRGDEVYVVLSYSPANKWVTLSREGEDRPALTVGRTRIRILK